MRELLDLLAARGAGRAAPQLTEDGHATAARLIGARRACLTSLVADWQPDDDPRVNDAIARLRRELGAEPPR